MKRKVSTPSSNSNEDDTDDPKPSSKKKTKNINQEDPKDAVTKQKEVGADEVRH